MVRGSVEGMVVDGDGEGDIVEFSGLVGWR